MRTAFLIVVLTVVQTQVAWSFDDPTRPGGYQTPVTKSFKGARLESVLISQQRKVAIIDGKSYQPGDSVAGAKLMTIEPHRVTIRKGSKTIELKLLDVDIKRESKMSGN